MAFEDASFSVRIIGTEGMTRGSLLVKFVVDAASRPATPVPPTIVDVVEAAAPRCPSLYRIGVLGGGTGALLARVPVGVVSLPGILGYETGDLPDPERGDSTTGDKLT